MIFYYTTLAGWVAEDCSRVAIHAIQSEQMVGFVGLCGDLIVSVGDTCCRFIHQKIVARRLWM